MQNIMSRNIQKIIEENEQHLLDCEGNPPLQFVGAMIGYGPSCRGTSDRHGIETSI
tara:strand:+ start:2306 stop:2473 length:168 start_codon:yes stop_codon:yes gene_type:complete